MRPWAISHKALWMGCRLVLGAPRMFSVIAAPRSVEPGIRALEYSRSVGLVGVRRVSEWL